MFKHLYLIAILLTCFVPLADAQIDSTIGIKAPKSVSRNYKNLAHHLCDNLEGDAQKVNAIYNWITHNIRYDVKALQKGELKRLSTKQVLKKRKALCDGYSELFSDMCNEAGVRAVVVSGYGRDWIFDDSDKLYTPRHAWNAVAIGDSWYLVDVTWGAGVVGQFPGWMQRKMSKMRKDPVQVAGKLRFKYQYDPSFLMQAPSTFREKHLPYDPIWQLTDSLMPLYLFEAGDASIATFNKTYGRPMLNYKELNRFVQQPEHLKDIQEAERAYAYNPRYHVSMAIRHQANAIDSMASMDKHAPPAVRQVVIAQVKQELKTAQSFVALQKKSIATEYTELKAKNKKKNAAAKAHIRKLNNNNTQAIARCKAKIKSSDTKFKALGTKAGSAIAANKKAMATDFRGIQTASPEDDTKSERLKQLEDSIQSRIIKLNKAQGLMQQEEKEIEQLIAANSKRLDSLVAWLQIADSALIQETIGRINMQDNYDAEIKKWTALYESTRFAEADSLQRRYLAAYDTNLVHYELLRKQQTSSLDAYRKNFKELAQYKKRNSSNFGLLSLYDKQLSAYHAAYDEHLKMMSEYGSYIKSNKSLFEQMVKHYERQEKLAGYMERSEEHRQELEEKMLSKKEAFDKKENAYQKKQLEQSEGQAQQYIDKKRSL